MCRTHHRVVPCSERGTEVRIVLSAEIGIHAAVFERFVTDTVDDALADAIVHCYTTMCTVLLTTHTNVAACSLWRCGIYQVPEFQPSLNRMIWGSASSAYHGPTDREMELRLGLTILFVKPDLLHLAYLYHPCPEQHSAHSRDN